MLLISTCSSEPPRWSCDDADLQVCIEYENMPPEAKSQFMKVCSFGMGVWSDHGCPRELVYVGCRLESGGFAQTLWEKRPENVDQVQRSCPGVVVYGKATRDAGARDTR
jgi:hypothetical protein